jgi:4-amino-4-deoxy-L-arabinose transferase-like glycosyltransferase
MTRMFERPVWQAVLAAGSLAWLAIGLMQWFAAAPLGHDEAQYAIAAKDVLSGQPQRWFYLSTGMNALAVPGVLIGDSEHALRIVPLLAGLGFLTLTWLVARRVVGELAAAWAIAVLAGSRTLIQRSTDLLSDLPAAGLLIGGTWILVSELSRDGGPRWRITFAAPFLAAALYVRYGSAVPIAIICAAALLIWWRPILRRPLPVIAAAAAFAVLLLPHMIVATRTMGSPLGILLASKSVPGNDLGLVTYVTSNPFRYYGLLAPFPLLAGMLSIAAARDRRRIYLWLVAVSSIVAMGIITHAQPRYIFFGTTLLVILGADAIVRTVSHLAPRARQVIAGGALVAIALTWLSCGRRAFRYPHGVRHRQAGAFLASAAIRADAAGAPCMVLGRHLTQMEWYSGCRGVVEPQLAAIARGVPFYVVWTNSGVWQPDLGAMPGEHRTIFYLPMAHVIRLQPPRG